MDTSPRTCRLLLTTTSDNVTWRSPLLPVLLLLLCHRLSFGMGADGQVAMKVVSRGDSEEASEAVHSIIQEA
jgi:hypothetical protein